MSTRTLLTTYGNDKILQAIASGTTVKIVAIAYGDGNGEQYEPSADQTSLRNELGRLTSLVKEFNPVDGFIYFKATIPANTNAFVLREFGLIDDTGGLISVTVIPDVEKPVASDGVSIALPISIGFKTSTGEVMVVVENGTDVYATTSLNNLNDTGEHHFDNTYATIDLDNLSLTGERHFLGRTHITNCITEVPQRIKYKLTNGTLTIKAGSVIIVPYGVEDLSSTYLENSVFLNENFKVVSTQYSNNKFFVWTTLQNDISTIYTTGAYHLSVFVDVENNELVSFDRFTDASGDTAPSVTASFYNTSTNTISRYSAGTQVLANLSFPIVRMTTTDSQIASIDELFNGLSHIGSTLILDKEVRLLIPNGRNENGSLNNEAFITSKITLGQIDLSIIGNYNLFYNYTNDSIAYIQKTDYYLSPPNDSLANNRVYYDFTTNIFTQYINSIKTENLYCQIGSLYIDKDHAAIASFDTKFAFRAMDYNDLTIYDNLLNKLNGKNIGELTYSALPLNDINQHLLDGSLLQYGIYKEFIDYIADLYAENPSANYFTTESEWQTSVATYGVCGKFVYDSTNNTVRLPKVTGKIDGTTDINALGDLEPLFVKLPNITGTVNSVRQGNQWWRSFGGAFYDNGVRSQADQANGNGNQIAGIGFDASRSSSVYSGNGSDTSIHEQAIKCFVYIVVANSTKTDIQVDIDKIATDLNGKADKDLGNTNPTSAFYVNVANNIMPNYSAGVGMSNGSIAPMNGFLRCRANVSNSNSWDIVYINGVEVYTFKHNDGYAMTCDSIVPISQGDRITTSGAISVLIFYPLKGA